MRNITKIRLHDSADYFLTINTKEFTLRETHSKYCVESKALKFDNNVIYVRHTPYDEHKYHTLCDIREPGNIVVHVYNYDLLNYSDQN